MNEIFPKNTRNIILLIAILGITFVVFSPILNNPFITIDDNAHLLNNMTVRSLTGTNIVRIFKDVINKTYIPLTVLSYAVEYHFFGFHPFIYYLDNLLLHLGVTGLVFLIALRCGLSIRAAAFGALLFGIHPMRVESVAWITERKDVLYAFFY